MKIERSKAPANHVPVRVPTVNGNGLIALDPWWGIVQPMQLHERVKTIGELELVEHLEAGGKLIDTRRPEYVTQSGTIADALVMHWETIVTDINSALDSGQLEQTETIAYYCNGPQCPATPKAIAKLLESGWPPESILYYRGGVMDWQALGFPLT